MPISFRFFNVWCGHNDFNKVVQEVWDSIPFSYNFIQTTMNKLKATKKKLMGWNIFVFGNVHKAIVEASSDLKKL